MRPADAIDPTHAGVHGLMGSVANEYPQWRIRIADLEIAAAIPIKDLFVLPADALGNAWGYRQGQWYRQQLLPVALPPIQQPCTAATQCTSSSAGPVGSERYGANT